jgi:hypothetical protein
MDEETGKARLVMHDMVRPGTVLDVALELSMSFDWSSLQDEGFVRVESPFSDFPGCQPFVQNITIAKELVGMLEANRHAEARLNHPSRQPHRPSGLTICSDGVVRSFSFLNH